MKKKKKKKIFIFSIFVCIFIVLVSVYFIMNKDNNTLTPQKQTTEEKLMNLGYNNKDIPVIINNNDILEYVLEHPYIENLTDYINIEGFMLENMDAYLNYENENKEASVKDIVYIVNNGITIKYSETLSLLIKEEYFIKDRIDRYFSYKVKHSNKNIDDIVREVNCNLDYDYYTNIASVDTTYGELMLVNKYYYLDKYVNNNLVNIEVGYTRNGGQLAKVTLDAFKSLSDEAKKQGLNILNQSAYRSYDSQSYIYNSYLLKDPQHVVDTYSARAGHSEHQTGYALDVATYTTVSLGDFEYTNEFTWMNENAYKFGFILRYPKGKEHLTGYMYEPWHYRYVGIEVATELKEKNITFDEYYAYYIAKK